MKRLLSTLGFLGAFATLLTSEPAAAADEAKPLVITDPAARTTKTTAYVHPQGQFFTEVGLLGVQSTDLYAAVGVGYGIGWGFEVNMNVAHASAALFNLGAKWNFIEGRFGALSIGFEPMFIAGDLMWLPPYDRLLQSFDVWVLPVGVAYTGRPFDWLDLDLAATYTAIETSRQVDPDALIFKGGLGATRFSLRPGIRAHVMGRLSLYANVELPVWFAERVEFSDFGDALIVAVGARAMMSDHWFVDFGLNGGDAVKPLYGSEVFPRMNLEARF